MDQQQHSTITETHPYHADGYVSTNTPNNPVKFKPKCPRCREDFGLVTTEEHWRIREQRDDLLMVARAVTMMESNYGDLRPPLDAVRECYRLARDYIAKVTGGAA